MKITSPLDEKTARGLKTGQVVFLNGIVMTGRDEMHMRALSRPAEGLNGATLFHCGPIMLLKDGKWEVIAAGPTTSARMDSAAPEIIRKYRIRAMIGKGGMSDDVLKAMKEVGCVYLAAIGGAAVSLAEGLTAIGVHWEDLGMAEAMWKFKAENLGPLVVAMDADGKSIYKEIASKTDSFHS
ncbi:MAG: FumA C-terminus/TtdB family hydratase beta subunit [Methanomassiliicoccaceae archaeon]|nr:FumA C-terminus/TtdB family hydratase beta subunit [Methanomassiliicoccaceae archaeon]